MRKLIFGCGYLGRRVAALWREAGDEVFVVTRSSERGREFAELGLHPIVADLTDPASLTNLPGDIDTVLFAVGYDRASGKSIHDVYVGGLKQAMHALGHGPRRFIYISSTGVFGQGAGDWVDEDSPCDPQREGGKACLAAEHFLQSQAIGLRTVVLRLAGIYGPGRIPLRQQLAAGEPIAAPSAGYLNLIHVADAARIVCLAELNSAASKIYLVADGNPVVRAEYYRHLARLIGAPEPKFTDPPAGSPAAARAASDKRINTARLVRELQPDFLFPSYREGLASIVAESENSPSPG